MKLTYVLLIFLLLTDNVSGQSKELIPYYDNGKFGYSDETGMVIIKPEYSYAAFFKYGFARVYLPDQGLKVGANNICFINTKGQNIFKDTFQNASDFFYLFVEEKPGIFSKQPVANIVKGGKPFLISAKGKIISSKTSNVNESKNDLIETYEDFGYRILNNDDYTKKGIAVNSRTIIEPIYDAVSVIDLNKGIFIVEKDGKQGLINQSISKDVQWYESIGLIGFKDKLINEYAFMYKVGMKNGIVNEVGTVLLEPIYDWMVPLDPYDDTKMLYGKYIDGKLIMGLYDAKQKKQLFSEEYTNIEKTHLANIYKVKKVINEKELEFYVNINGVQYINLD